jgi:hypothetical protein
MRGRRSGRLLGLFRTLRDERRALGWKGLFRKRGPKLLIAFVIAYLIRDLVLYVAIPLGLAAWLVR